MSALAGVYNIIADQGATFTRAFRRKDHRNRVAPFEATSARMQVRPNHESAQVLLEATTENGRISLDGPSARIDVQVPASIMGALSAGTHVYDLEIIFSDETVERMVMGNFVVRKEVTR